LALWFCFVQTLSAQTIDWTAAPPLQLPRDHHATFLVQSSAGDFLYVAGGTNYRQIYDNIVRARINADGQLGNWEEAGKYPLALAGTSVAVSGRFAVLTGGQIATTGGVRGLKRVAETYVATVDDRGRLGPWRPAPALPAPRFHHPSVAYNDWVYVVGGQGEKEAESGVFGARLTPEGTIAEWVTLRPLPRPRSHHAAFIDQGYLYVLGGLDGVVGGHNAHFTDVIRAQIAEDGTLGDWQIVSRTPHALATHAAFAHNGALWALGGVEDGSRFVGTIWRAPIGQDQKIGAWEEVKPGLPVARGHVHNTPVLGTRVYTAGGRGITTSPSDSPALAGVFVGTFK
jgi:hypothetical protein